VLSRALRIQEEEFALDRTVVAAYPPPFQRLVLRRLWTRLVPLGPGLTHSHLTVLLRLVGRPRPAASVRLPGGWTAGSNRGTIVFRSPPGSTTDRRDRRVHGPSPVRLGAT